MEETATYQTVELKKIECDSDRRHGKDEGFEQLVESIRKHGIIEPPVVRHTGGGRYRAVAGRRRIEAARQLGHKAVTAKVLPEGDPRGDEEIALTENVNRAEMHPLDEAALFSRMAERGAAVTEIARYYARSPQAIYKRLRLVSLTEELKGMFRDGAISIASAAVLAELPEGDQEAFWSQYGSKEHEIPQGEVAAFVARRQRFAIKESMEGCEGCAKRTHNGGNDLFEEFQYMDDVCLDGECYRRNWKAMIEGALAEGAAGYGPHTTDKKIFFANGVPAELYKKAAHVNFSNDEGLNVEYEVMKGKDYEFAGETKRKKGACWLVRADCGGKITAVRAGYKQKPPKGEREAAGQKAKNAPDEGLIEQYGREALEAAAAGRGAAPGELAQALRDRGVGSYEFTDKIKELACRKVIERRIAADKSGAQPHKDYFSMFLRQAEEELYMSHTFKEGQFSDEQKQWLRDLLGAESLKKLGLPNETRALFHFLLLCVGFEGDVPDLDDLKNAKRLSDNLFWEYAGTDAEDYRELWLEAAKEAAAGALAPKPKKGSPARAGGKKKAAAEEKAAEKGNARTCRICGFTDRDCEPSDWAGEDLCNECAADLDDPETETGDACGDEYPF